MTSVILTWADLRASCGYNLTSISSCSLVMPLFFDINAKRIQRSQSVGYTFCVQPNKQCQSDGLYQCLH